MGLLAGELSAQGLHDDSARGAKAEQPFHSPPPERSEEGPPRSEAEWTETQRAEILGHAKQCDHCANQLRELRVLENLLQGPLRDALQDLHPSADTLVDFATSRKEEAPREDTSLERPTKKNDLSAQEIERISRHIENCPRCSEEARLVADAVRISDGTVLETLPPIPDASRERWGKAWMGGAVRIVRQWLRPRLLVPLAATVGIALVAYTLLRPEKTRLVALPILITDQTFSTLHGGTGVDLDPLIAQLDAAYSESLDQARRNTRSLDIEAPKTSLVRRGRAGDLVGRPLAPDHKPDESASPGKRSLILEIQMFVKDRNICSLRSVVRSGDGTIGYSQDHPDFNCQEAPELIRTVAIDTLLELDSQEASQ